MQDEAETFGCYLTDEISEDDPAKSDPALNERLVQSKKLAKERENKVLSKLDLKYYMTKKNIPLCPC